MVSTEEYIKHVIVDCECRSILFYTQAGRWSKMHWILGISNSVLGGAMSLLSFVALLMHWGDTTTWGMAGGLLMSVTNGIFTSIKAGQNEINCEKAGDAYHNCKESLLASLSDTKVDMETLRGKAEAKMLKLSGKYPELSPMGIMNLQQTVRAKIFNPA